MRGLDKTERGAVRKAVRQVWQVTLLELAEMHPQEERTARAEMRKRGFWLDTQLCLYARRYGLHQLANKTYWPAGRP